MSQKNINKQSDVDKKPINILYEKIAPLLIEFNKAFFIREIENYFEVHLQPSFIGLYELQKLNEVVNIYNVQITNDEKIRNKDALMLTVTLKE